MKEVTVEYFALLMQEANTATETVATSAVTVADLYAELQKIHLFSLSEKQVRATINKRLVTDWQTPFAGGDHILFIPPLVGG